MTLRKRSPQKGTLTLVDLCVQPAKTPRVKVDEQSYLCSNRTVHSSAPLRSARSACCLLLCSDFSVLLCLVRREAVELQVRRMMQQLASNPDKLAQAIRRIDSGETLGGGDGEEDRLFSSADAAAAGDGGGPVMASPVKTKLQQVFEEYSSRPRRPLATAGGGGGGDLLRDPASADTTTTAEEDDTEEEASSKYSM